MLVLWIIALLTIIAVAMTSAQRTESTLSGNQLDAARFRAEADAAIAYAALQLMASPVVELDEAGAEWVPDGQPRNWTFAGANLEITVFNEASLIDLNQAPRELLVGLLRAVGVDDHESETLVDSVLDWRDEDDLHLALGAEDADYVGAGLSYGAKDGRFDSTEELRQVLGMRADLYHVIAPILTVHGGGRIDESLAPSLVLAALRGTTVEEIEAQRLLDPGIVDSGAAAGNRGGPLYRVRVARVDEAGARLAMEALVSVQRGSSASPLGIVWRRYGLFAESAAARNLSAEVPEL